MTPYYKMNIEDKLFYFISEKEHKLNKILNVFFKKNNGAEDCYMVKCALLEDNKIINKTCLVTKFNVDKHIIKNSAIKWI